MLIDSHCHLSFSELQCRLPAVLQNAKENDVTGMLCVSTDFDNTDVISEIVKNNKNQANIWMSAGIHPLSVNQDSILKTEQYLNHWKKNIVAVGETGLDLFKSENLTQQIESFKIHLNFSIKNNLPIILHTRSAETETYDSLKSSYATGVVHCFTGTKEFARKMLNLGWYISFSGIVTFKNSENLREVARYVPLNSMLIETDSPYLAPTPYRGKQNEPAYVKYVAQYIANIKNVTYELVASQTTHNFYKLFNTCNEEM